MLISSSRVTLAVVALACVALTGAKGETLDQPGLQDNIDDAVFGDNVKACTRHAECSATEYCEFNSKCFGCETCYDDDTIDGVCPEKCKDLSPQCSTHDECAGEEFCTVFGDCWHCENCLDESAVDGACPKRCDAFHQCTSHEQCGADKFCTYDRLCDDCKFCSADEARNGVCPTSCAAIEPLAVQAECSGHSDCATDEYCTWGRQCWQCNRCSDGDLLASFDGFHCPEHCNALPERFEMREDNFVLLSRHKDVSHGFFSGNVVHTGIENLDNPDANTYSIIGAVNPSDLQLNDGRYEFELIYDYRDHTRDVLKWSQRSWPTEASVDDANLSDIADSAPVGTLSFAGLAKSALNYAYLDGSPSHNHWWHAVASVSPYQNGIPAHEGKVAYHSELWVRRGFHQCTSHEQCDAAKFCTYDGECADCKFCSAGATINGVCPTSCQDECVPFDVFLSGIIQEANEVGEVTTNSAERTQETDAPNEATNKIVLPDYKCSVDSFPVNASDATQNGAECDVANACGDGYSQLFGSTYLCVVSADIGTGWHHTGVCVKHCHAPATLDIDSSVPQLNCTNGNTQFNDLSKPMPVETVCEAVCDGERGWPNIDSSFKCVAGIGATTIVGVWAGHPLCEPQAHAQ